MNLWLAFVKEIHKNNPHLLWKEVLQVAKPHYKIVKHLVTKSIPRIAILGGDRTENYETRVKRKAMYDILMAYSNCVGQNMTPSDPKTTPTDLRRHYTKTVERCLLKKKKLSKFDVTVLEHLGAYAKSNRAIGRLLKELHIDNI